MSTARVRLTFPEHLITQPVLARMMRRFDVEPNIRRANVEEKVGWIMCELAGDRELIESAITWLRDEGVEVDRLGDVVEG
ncbi:MAG: NIL domain-containing protein [Acidimicrobiales bacterium]